MTLDIILVTYNSSKYIKKCIETIIESEYNLKHIGIKVYDNASTDNSITILEELKTKYEKELNSFQIIKGKKNIGFGKANNLAAKTSNAKYLLFLNIDCEIYPDTLKKIEENIQKYKKFGILELKQEPYEHPKYYDPISMKTSWASGACMILENDLFKRIKGFDKNIFMYCEDVEISYKVRKLGYDIYYLYDVPIIHYAYQTANQFKKNQYLNTAPNNMYLRFKYGSFKDILKGLYINVVFYRNIKIDDQIKENEKDDYKKNVKKLQIKMFLKGILAYLKRIKFIFSKKIKLDFIGLDYSGVKDGTFLELDELDDEPHVSIIVRTCKRPSYLRETLLSIKRQTYKNLEVIVVEDGEDTASKIINEEFYDMNIKYFALGKNMGRSVAGNKGLELATGKYINFLDDDDVFYPDHVESLVKKLEKSDKIIAYATAFETPIIVHSKDPYKYTLLREKIVYSTDFSLLKLLYSNIFPIQTVMFSREVYNECGGFDTNLDALEDWDLWLKYAMKYDFDFLKKTTSIYRVPAIKEISLERQKFLTDALETVRNKYKNNDVVTNGIELLDFCNYFLQVNSNPRAVFIKKILRKLKILK